jgi:RNA polymerase sigma-70 factor (ECF subfamily)
MEPYNHFADKERPILVRYIKAKFSFDNSRADDVVQDALIQGFERDQKSGFDDEQYRRSYVYQCARHRAIDEIRRSDRQAQAATDGGGEDLLDSSDAVMRETQEFIAGYSVEQIRSALAELLPQWYEILFLAFYKGLRNDEIACRLKLTKKTVEGRKHRALERLRKILGGEDK